MDEFPNNSHKKKDAPEKAKVEQITSGTVSRRKQPLGKKLRDTFIGGDAKSVWGYIFFDVMMPAAKDMVVDATSQGVERMVFGESTRGNRRGRTQGGYTAYNRFATSPGRREEVRREISRRGRATHEFDEIILESRPEAEQVVDRLYDLIAQYNSATVADLYDLVGVTGSFADEKWGWTDLRGAGVSRVRSGYLLDLPRPEALD